MLALAVGVSAAYSLSRFQFRGSANMSGWILSTRMMPPIITAVPLFWMMRRVGLTGSHLGLILIYVMTQLPFVIWMMKGFFDEVPKSIEESVLVDGGPEARSCSGPLPLAFRGIVATALFCVFLTWTEFLLLAPHRLHQGHRFRWPCPVPSGSGHSVGSDERGDGGGLDPADDHHHGAAEADDQGFDRRGSEVAGGP